MVFRSFAHISIHSLTSFSFYISSFIFILFSHLFNVPSLFSVSEFLSAPNLLYFLYYPKQGFFLNIVSKFLWELWGFHGDVSSRGLLGCDAV